MISSLSPELAVVAISIAAFSLVVSILALVKTSRHQRMTDPVLKTRNFAISTNGWSPQIRFDVVNSGRSGTHVVGATAHFRESWLRATDKTLRLAKSGRTNQSDWVASGQRVEPMQTISLLATLPLTEDKRDDLFRPDLNRKVHGRIQMWLDRAFGRRVRIVLTLGNGSVVRSRFRDSPRIQDLFGVMDEFARQQEQKRLLEEEDIKRFLRGNMERLGLSESEIFGGVEEAT